MGTHRAHASVGALLGELLSESRHLLRSLSNRLRTVDEILLRAALTPATAHRNHSTGVSHAQDMYNYTLHVLTARDD